MNCFNGLWLDNRLIASTAFEYGEGHSFKENPWMWIWIALRLSGIRYFGAFVTPTITVTKRDGFFRKGRPWEIIRVYPHKVLNKKGWRNCGIDNLIGNELPRLGENIRKAIISVGTLGFIDEVPSMLVKLDPFGIAAVEINPSCHNVDLCFLNDRAVFRSLCKKSRQSSRHALGVKLNAESDYITMAKTAQDEGINFIHAINTIFAYSNSMGSCGMSSYKNKQVALKVIDDLRKNGVEIPIVGGSGIWTMKDIRDYENAGAQIFSVSHQFLYFSPWLSMLARKLK